VLHPSAPDGRPIPFLPPDAENESVALSVIAHNALQSAAQHTTEHRLDEAAFKNKLVLFEQDHLGQREKTIKSFLNAYQM
jgi:hypothetical protein